MALAECRVVKKAFIIPTTNTLATVKSNANLCWKQSNHACFYHAQFSQWWRPQIYIQMYLCTLN